MTSPPYLRVVKYGYYNWLRTWFLGFDARAIDATLDDAHHREPYLLFLRDVLAGLRPVLADDAVVVLVIGDVETDRGRRIQGGVGLAERTWEAAAEPEGYRLAGVALDDVAADPEDDQAVGRRGGPGDQDGPDPRPRRDRGRPPPGAGRRRRSTSTGPGRRGRSAPSRMPPCGRCTTRPTSPRWIRWYGRPRRCSPSPSYRNPRRSDVHSAFFSFAISHRATIGIPCTRFATPSRRPYPAA